MFTWARAQRMIDTGSQPIMGAGRLADLRLRCWMPSPHRRPTYVYHPTNTTILFI